jgi:dienelactone hydrolase
MKIPTLGLAIALCWMHLGGFAQPLAEKALAIAHAGPDLKFPEQAHELSSSSPLEMAIYKPQGAGPFPAVVIVHSCGGLRPEMRTWSKAALDRGYVVFVMDSLYPRGLDNGCYPPRSVGTPRGAKDALQAREHLRKFPFVDQDRVALVGFSWGAMVGLLVSSKAVANQLSSVRFNAVASFYPFCYFPGGGQFPAFEFLRADVDKPLLLLMGGEDTETPPAECLPRLERLRSQGAPVESHLYPNATHCWDCSSLGSFSKIDFQGNRVFYRYDPEVTQDSTERTFAFFARHLRLDK